MVINALCAMVLRKVSIGKFTIMSTSPFIFLGLHYFRWKIFEENVWSVSLSLYIWNRNDCTRIDHNTKRKKQNISFWEQWTILRLGTSWMCSWSQIFWMAQEIFYKYLIISNNYFTMKGCTEKEAILDFSFTNIAT